MPNELITGSAKKRRRTEPSKKPANDEDTSTPTKRQRLPVRNKGGEKSPEAVHSDFVIEIPVREASEEATDPTPTTGSKRRTPKSKGRPEEQDAEVAIEDAVAEPSLEEEGGHAEKEDSMVAPMAPETPVAKHKKFDDNDPVEAVVDEKLEDNVTQDVEDDESSDDEAPEEVGALAAQSKAKKASREEAKAVEQ